MPGYWPGTPPNTTVLALIPPAPQLAMHQQLPQRILFIVTSADRIGPNSRKTGYEFSEVAHPYLAFLGEGHQVDFASPVGGRPPEDGYDPGDSASRIFRSSPGFERLNASQALHAVDLATYDAIFFPGGLGPMVDLLHNPHVKHAVAEVHEGGRVVGAVCHGPVALMNVQLTNGMTFLEGRHVAAFTEAEERGYSDKDVPFMLDAGVVREGARHSHAAPFQEHVVIDDRLVTGQNPASAAGVAKAMMQVLAAKTATTK